MNDDELLPTDDVPTDDVPSAEAPAEVDPGAVPDLVAVAAAGEATADPNDGPDSGPLADAPPVAPPREVIRGIHPELLCTCPECAPDFVELQWFSPEEQKKVKGDVMLFCARSSRKYFTPMIELMAWITEKGGPRKARRGGGD